MQIQNAKRWVLRLKAERVLPSNSHPTFLRHSEKAFFILSLEFSLRDECCYNIFVIFLIPDTKASVKWVGLHLKCRFFKSFLEEAYCNSSENKFN